MPTVPRLNDSGVQNSGIPNVSVSGDAPIESFGGGQGLSNVFESGTKMVGEVSDYLKKEEEAADLLAVENLKDKLIRKKNLLYWGDGQNVFGAVSKRGQEAMESKQGYVEAFNDFTSKEISALSNDRQKALATRVAREQEYDLSGNLNRHIAGEIERFKIDVTKSSIESLQDDASKNWMNPDKISKSISEQKSAILNYHDSANVPEDQQNIVVKRQIQEAESKTHSGVITSMVHAKEPLLAQGYFNAIKDRLTGQDLSKVESIIKEGVVRANGQKMEDEIYNKHQGSEQDALKEARQIENPEYRDEAVRRLKMRFSEEREAKRADAETRTKAAIEYAKVHKERPPEAVWALMAPDERKAVDFTIQGGNVVTDLNRLYQIKQMVGTPEFQKMNLILESSRISKSDLEPLMDLQTGLRGGANKAKELADGIRSDQEIINTTLKTAGINPSSKTTSVQVKVDAYRKAVDDEVVQTQKQTGKKVTNAELEEIAKRLLKESITVKGILFDSKKRLFEATPEERALAVPKNDRQQIIDSLRRAKVPVTENTIIDIYNRKKNSDANK